MSKYTVTLDHQPSPEENFRWSREASYFTYRPPNPNDPKGSSGWTGWGIPEVCKPPVDVVSYVAATFKREVAGVSVTAELRPEFQWSIFSVCMAHFLWFRTEDGANWLLKFYGVEEVPPFNKAYVYTYLDHTKLIDGQPTRVPLDAQSGLALRVFRRCERDLEAPIDHLESEVIKDMQRLLDRARKPEAGEAIAHATTEMYHWVSERIREWLDEPKADLRWPTHKPDRISGPQWARNVKRASGEPFFEALHKVDEYNGAAYRIKDQHGGKLWCGSNAIRCMLMSDYARNTLGFSNHNIENVFQCSSCGKTRTCTPVTNSQKMCCHCFGSIVEKDLRPTLDWCTMRECKHCTDHIESQRDLINIKNRLNRETPFPVRR